jgi:hypothetical protein
MGRGLLVDLIDANSIDFGWFAVTGKLEIIVMTHSGRVTDRRKAVSFFIFSIDNFDIWVFFG